MSEKPQLWSYVVIFEKVTVSEFTTAIDKFPKSIPNWMTVLPQTVFVVSPLTASNLNDFLREKIPTLGRMLVLDAKTDRNGWLPKNAWDFLSNPKPAPSSSPSK